MAREGTGKKDPETEKGQTPTTEAEGAVETETEVGKEENSEETPEAEVPETPEVPEETVETATEEVPVEITPAEASKLPTGRGMAKKADPKIQEQPKKEMATIIIDEARTDTEQQDVFVTDPSDGTPFQIQRGKQVDVPIGVLNNLRESIQEKLVRNKETSAEAWKKVPRFSFTVIKEYTK